MVQKMGTFKPRTGSKLLPVDTLPGVAAATPPLLRVMPHVGRRIPVALTEKAIKHLSGG